MTLPATLDGPATAPRSWRAPSQPILTRVDLQGLVERGALTGLHMQSDGSLLLDCPAALPAELEGLVEEAEPGVEDRLARMEQNLSTLTQELREKERMADRLDAVEFGLAERLQGVIAEEVLNLFAEQETGPSVVERIEHLLEAARAPAPTSDLAEQILARLPDPERMEALLQRTPDLSPLRQMNAQFLQAMQHVVTRLDTRVAEIEPEALGERLMAQLARLHPKAPDLDPLFARLEACLAPMQATLTQLVDRVSALENRPAPVFDMTENRRSFAAFATALSTSLRRIESLDAKLDQTPALRAEVERLGMGLTALGDRIDEMRPADLSPIGAALTALTEHVANLTVPPEALAPTERALASLTARVEAMNLAPALDALSERLTALERRPVPAPDLTEQRKSFAGFATAIGATLRRIEALADRMEAQSTPLADLAPRIEALVSPQARSEPLADAILALAQRAADRDPGANLPGFEAFRAAQQDFFQDLRFLLAEIIATQMRQQAQAS